MFSVYGSLAEETRQFLLTEGFKPTGINIRNRYARYGEFAEDAAVVHLQDSGDFRVYDFFGNEVGFGKGIWELKGIV